MLDEHEPRRSGRLGGGDRRAQVGAHRLARPRRLRRGDRALFERPVRADHPGRRLQPPAHLSERDRHRPPGLLHRAKPCGRSRDDAAEREPSSRPAARSSTKCSGRAATAVVAAPRKPRRRRHRPSASPRPPPAPHRHPRRIGRPAPHRHPRRIARHLRRSPATASFRRRRATRATDLRPVCRPPGGGWREGRYTMSATARGRRRSHAHTPTPGPIGPAALVAAGHSREAVEVMRLEPKIATRMGDGSLVEMTRSEIKADSKTARSRRPSGPRPSRSRPTNTPICSTSTPRRRASPRST